MATYNAEEYRKIVRRAGRSALAEAYGPEVAAKRVAIEFEVEVPFATFVEDVTKVWRGGDGPPVETP